VIEETAVVRNINLEIMAAVIGAVIGALAALIGTFLLEWNRARNRRNSIASAFAYQIRLIKRQVEWHLKAFEKNRSIVFDAGYSNILYKSLLRELPDLGSNVFTTIPLVYAQLRQINYLKNEFKESAKHNTPLGPNFLESYPAAHKRAIEKAKGALEALAGKASKKSLTSTLPGIKTFTNIEKAHFEIKD